MRWQLVHLNRAATHLLAFGVLLKPFRTLPNPRQGAHVTVQAQRRSASIRPPVGAVQTPRSGNVAT